MKARIVAAVAALALAVAPAAYAADTLDFWDGASTSGQCGAATFLGSQKIDDPNVSGIQQAGTIQKYKRTCSYPTSANQTCWYTQGSRVGGGTVKIGVGWRSDGGVNYYLSDSGIGTVTSPVICAHQVDGTSWWGWAQIDGRNATLYT